MAAEGKWGAPTVPLEMVLVYDSEIQRGWPDRKSGKLEGVEYCDGRDDFPGMGVAVIGAFDFYERRPRTFMPDNLDAFRELAAGRLVVGWNTHGFDDLLLGVNGCPLLPCEGHEGALGQSWDLMRELRFAAGEPRDFQKGRWGRRGRTLDAVAAANLSGNLRGKTGSGAMAPVLWQQRRYGELIDYCLADVYLLAGVVRKVPHIIDPILRRQVLVPAPWTGPYLEEAAC